MNIYSSIIIIVIIIVIIIFGILLFHKNSVDKYSNEPIDVVYTWVDEYDPERELYVPTDYFRYNNNDELQYSIRSLFKYCREWLGTIYIVVKDGQVPKFIDFSNPQIVLVNHSEIMPLEALPTFNSFAIELCIHKIKNLRNTYVYLNDDLFFNEKFNPTTNNGKIKVFINTNGNYYPKKATDKDRSFGKIVENTLYVVRELLKIDYTRGIGFCHAPSVCYKPWEIEIENLLISQGLWMPLVMYKNRKNGDMAVNGIFRNLYYSKKSNVKMYDIKDNYYDLTSNCDFYPKSNEQFFTINTIGQNCKKTFIEIIEKIYPEKSPIEF